MPARKSPSRQRVLHSGDQWETSGISFEYPIIGESTGAFPENHRGRDGVPGEVQPKSPGIKNASDACRGREKKESIVRRGSGRVGERIVCVKNPGHIEMKKLVAHR